MRTPVRPIRVAATAVTVGAVGGLVAYASLPAYRGYTAVVMAAVSGLTPLAPPAPGLLIALAVAFLIGVSMNFLPCNVPIVMTLLPATAGAESNTAFLRRTALYGLGAVAVLATIGFALGWAGAAVKPHVVAYPSVGVYVAGAVVGAVGWISIGWGLRELGVISLPSGSLPFMDALRREADRRSGRSSYVVLGAVYGGTGGGCPMPTYHLLLLWVVAAANALFGAVLLGTYVLGRVLPVAVLGAAFRNRPTRAAEILGGRYERLRTANGVVLLAFGSLLVVFTGLRVLVGGT